MNCFFLCFSTSNGSLAKLLNQVFNYCGLEIWWGKDGILSTFIIWPKSIRCLLVLFLLSKQYFVELIFVRFIQAIFIQNLSNGTPSFELEMILELICETMSFAVLQRLHNIFTSNFKRYPCSMSLLESFSIHSRKKNLFSLHAYLQWKFFAYKIEMPLIILFICSVMSQDNDVNGRHYC